MSGQNQQIGSRSGRFENLDCPVEVGEECVMPNRRGWGFDRTFNLPTIISILGMLGGLASLAMASDRRATKTEGEVEVLRQVDKGIIDRAVAVEQVAIRDRAEMREDIKEIKQMLRDMRR